MLHNQDNEARISNTCEFNVTAVCLRGWPDHVLVAAEAAMKERERGSRDEEVLRLQAKLGEVIMANELLERPDPDVRHRRPPLRRVRRQPCRPLRQPLRSARVGLSYQPP